MYGNLYDSGDKELKENRKNAKRICYLFNNTNPDNVEEATEILSKLINAKGSFHIEPYFFCDYGYNITVGEGFYANHGCTILDVNKVEIGNNVMLGPNVSIFTATHPIDFKTRISGLEMGYPIKIGNNVWIGGGSIILPGVQIGDNSVIGAGSVVVKSIPKNCVAVGNPAKVIKNINN